MPSHTGRVDWFRGQSGISVCAMTIKSKAQAMKKVNEGRREREEEEINLGGY